MKCSNKNEETELQRLNTVSEGMGCTPRRVGVEVMVLIMKLIPVTASMLFLVKGSVNSQAMKKPVCLSHIFISTEKVILPKRP